MDYDKSFPTLLKLVLKLEGALGSLRFSKWVPGVF